MRCHGSNVSFWVDPPNAAVIWPEPALLWNGDTGDATPDILIVYEDPLANDTLTIQRCVRGNGFVSVTQWTYVMNSADILLSVLSLDLGTWASGDYDVRAMATRDGGTPSTGWSEILGVTIA